MFKTLIAFCLIAFSFVGGFAQKENLVSLKSSDLADKLLRELKLDLSTPEDAIKLLGKPSKDEFDDFSLSGEYGMFRVGLKRVIQTKENEKVFRKLTYKNLNETDDIILRFYEGKLVHIIFDYDSMKKEKRIPASSLPEKYNVDFVILQGLAKDSKLSDFEGQKESVIPKVYEVLYTLMSVQKDKIYLVRVNNNDSKGFWRSVAKKPTKELFPGVVIEMHLISRTLEKK